MEEKRKRGRPPKAKKLEVNQDKSFNIGNYEFMVRDNGFDLFDNEEDEKNLENNHKALINLNKKVDREKTTVSNFEGEIKELVKILSKYKKSNAIIVGKTGIGKTALVEKLAIEINKHKIPQLRDTTVYELSLNNLIAGTKYRGEFEEKIEKILQDVKNNKEVILFIDEIHNILGLNGNTEGNNMGLGEILKPSLARGEIRVIGATTPKEFRKSIKKDKALLRRFSILEVKEPTPKETLTVLLEKMDIYEKHYKVNLTYDDIDEIVKRARFKKGNNPDKSLDLLEEYCYKRKEEKNG